MSISGVPKYFLRSSSACVAMPTGQVLLWHCRAILHPMAINAVVPKP